MIDYLILSIGLIWLIFASVSDIKKREVPDWLSYSLIAIAISLRLIDSIISNQYNTIMYGLIGFIIFFSIGMLMYYSRQWGGGDVKLVMGIGILFATYPKFLLNYFNPNLETPFIISLLINLLLIGAVYGVIYSIILAIKNKNKFKKQLLDDFEKNKLKYIIILIISIILFIMSFITKEFYLKIILILTAFLILSISLLWLFIKCIEQSFLYKTISINKLTPGDWVNQDIIINKKLIYNKNSLGITEKQINLLKKSKIKNVLVKEGIPFTPVFLITILISLIFGNIIFLIV